MTTLRERVKNALAAREHDERAARADLDAVLARARRGRTARWPYVVVPAVVVAAIVVFVTTRPAPSPPLAVLAQSGDIHLYLHVDGEPADRAIAIDLTQKGTRK